MTQSPIVKDALAAAEDRMKKSLDRLRQEFASIRTGRASGALLDHVRVDYYGSMVSLKEVAAVGAPDGRTLEVRPWDAGALGAIEKAILASDLGLTPSNDGKIIRLSIPTLTEERRRDIAKSVKKVAEDFRVAVRNDRREALEKIRKAQKDKAISEDDLKSSEELLQKLTDAYVRRIDESTAVKEKELMEI